MSCGCNRNKKAIIKKNLTVVKLNTDLSGSQVSLRKKKCTSCPFNIQGGTRGRCKKSNRLISKLIIDSSFKCPISRF